ncbi:MAG TPA: glycerol-3-phosphate acyltransferase, partial [Bacteroidota bacterium]|nr:glycerol-3-phosphate acyltransferase [Bacteroidota bacterium]
TSGRDLRTEGSGNIGARNAFDVSGSKTLGIGVMGLDALKGALAVLVCKFAIDPDPNVMSCAGLASILGHNYSVWLRGKGGRGLATAAGVLLVLGWFVVAIWGIVWAIVNAIGKNVHVANVAALVLSPVAIALTPAGFISSITPAFARNEHITILASLVSLICLARHIEPMREYLKTR